MNPVELQTILRRGPQPEDLEILRACVQRHPYSGPIRMMLAKASNEAQDIERREDLLCAGAHVPSRRALIAYLMGPSLVAEARVFHDEVLKAGDVSEDELVSMVWHEHSSLDVNSDDEKIVVSDLDADQNAAANTGDKKEPDQRETIISAIASVIEKDVSTWNEDDERQDAEQRKRSIDSPTKTNFDSESSSGIAIPKIGRDPEPTSVFAQWLKQRAIETGFGSPETAEQGAAALIDAFLARDDVRIGPIRDSFETTEEWAKQGLLEDPSLVTETMAKLYAQQGQMGRARKAYKLLALKYPEKSVYFAAQLKMLRNT